MCAPPCLFLLDKAVQKSNSSARSLIRHQETDFIVLKQMSFLLESSFVRWQHWLWHRRMYCNIMLRFCLCELDGRITVWRWPGEHYGDWCTGICRGFMESSHTHPQLLLQYQYHLYFHGTFYSGNAQQIFIWVHFAKLLWTTAFYASIFLCSGNSLTSFSRMTRIHHLATTEPGLSQNTYTI